MKGYLIGLLSRIALVVCTIFYIVSELFLFFTVGFLMTLVSIIEGIIIMPLFYILTGVYYFDKIGDINTNRGMCCDVGLNTAGFYVFSVAGHWFQDLFCNLLNFLENEAGRHRLS